MARSLLSLVPAIFTMSDEQAMWRVKMDDDAQAFSRLVERWERPIQRLCTRMTGDEHRGEDLAQEAFARLFVRRKSYQPTGKFSTFLWRIALNLCYDELRKIKRRGEFYVGAQGSEDDPAYERYVSDEPGPEARLVEQERAEAVRRALLQLAETYRVVVVLRHYEGLKFREIGELLDIPEGTVKSRMAEALDQLNRILNPMFADEIRANIPTKESLVL